jgi:hypothetical protein
MVKGLERDWLLVAPWYRWPKKAVRVGDEQRFTAPVIQKFDSPACVDNFLDDPQRSLAFTSEDYVTSSTGRFALMKKSWSYFPAFVWPRKSVAIPTDVKKIFLEPHKRYYLVVCELHCDAAGLPSESFDKVCEAGFVVRRRRANPAGDADREGGTVELARDGWFSGDFEGVGAWRPVAATPDVVEEAYYPMYALRPDPAQTEHDGHGVSIYFGLLPTTALETELHGEPRYDSDGTFHVRCFVRRHDPGCPRGAKKPDCRGGVHWSEETDPYQLASFHDLDGTSNRPINLEMPDLAALKDKILASTRPGEFSPVRLKSKPPFSSGAFQICFLSIPLITIVALFVLNLFLPIVVFIFGLWFLLLLQLCILPKLSIDAGLEANLQPYLELPSASVDLSVSLDGLPAPRAALLAAFQAAYGSGPLSFSKPTHEPSDQELLRLARDAIEAKKSDPKSLGSNVGPLFSQKLVREARVLRTEVF